MSARCCTTSLRHTQRGKALQSVDRTPGQASRLPSTPGASQYSKGVRDLEPWQSAALQRCAFACSCTRCYFPAAACIASVIFCVVVGALLWRAALHMIHRVINRTLQRRLRAFLGLFVSGEQHVGLHFCGIKDLKCFCPL